MRVDPFCNFDDRNAPVAEDMTENRFVEVTCLPPCGLRVLELDLDQRERAADEVEDEAIRLAEANAMSGDFARECKPRSRHVIVGEAREICVRLLLISYT